MIRSLQIIIFSFFLPISVFAQDTTKLVSQDSDSPVNATADDLEVNTETNSAIFLGNAHVTQGELDLKAHKIIVFFDDSAQNIKLVEAEGKVRFTNGAEVAKSRFAKFDVSNQVITFSGNVFLQQDQNTISGNNLVYNVQSGQSKMTGNVKSVYIPE